MGKLEPDFRLYLSDKRVSTAEEAAVHVDDYVLIRGHFKNKGKEKEASKSTSQTNSKETSQCQKPVQNAGFPVVSQTPTHTSSNTHKTPFTCTFCHKKGHTKDRCWKKKGVVVKPSHFVRSNKPVVNVCSSPKVEKDSSVLSSPSKAVVVAEEGEGVSTAAPDVGEGGVVRAVAREVTSAECYTPYLFSGMVKLEGIQYPVRVLRDTGSSVTLWVKPVHVEVGSNDFVLIRGVTGVMTVPLVSCDVECKLFKGKAQVGVVESLPERGVDLLLGNDLVCGGG